MIVSNFIIRVDDYGYDNFIKYILPILDSMELDELHCDIFMKFYDCGFYNSLRLKEKRYIFKNDDKYERVINFIDVYKRTRILKEIII